VPVILGEGRVLLRQDHTVHNIVIRHYQESNTKANDNSLATFFAPLPLDKTQPLHCSLFDVLLIWQKRRPTLIVEDYVV
jgi:hypothetical protein